MSKTGYKVSCLFAFYFTKQLPFCSSNFRPSLTRAETIESCNSDDLVTVLEMHNRKPYKIIDRKREIKKGVMAESLEELVSRGDTSSINLSCISYCDILRNTGSSSTCFPHDSSLCIKKLPLQLPRLWSDLHHFCTII